MNALRRIGCRVRRDDRGSGTVELVIMASTYVVFMMIFVFVGRVNAGYASVETAARSAARSIAIARDPTTAMNAAHDQAATIAKVGSPKCRSMTFAPKVSATEATVTITCDVDLSEVVITGVPGHWTAKATASEPIDRWRENSDGFVLSGGPGGSSSRVGGL